MADQDSTRIKSADRVLDVLELLGDNPAGLKFPELVEALGIPKSSLLGLLKNLVARRYLVFVEAERRYYLGVQIFELGQSFLEHHPESREAKSAMEWVVQEVNETVQLAMLLGTESVNLAKVDSGHMLRLQSVVGRHFGAHASSVGKAILSGLDDDEIQRRFGEGPFAALTPLTHRGLGPLLEDVRQIRARGFSLDVEECTQGVFCVGVPIYGRAHEVTTAMSVTIPTIRLRRELLARALSCLAEASLQVSARMGVRGRDPQLQGLTQLPVATAALQNSPAEAYLQAMG
ncbi:IclR family transcriptional regulator [Thalassorhabdomicrobium marinisediminis]|uniref:IclR family transcriptional regulator n=1 Tax=Thalassorhabdomicrobium marinisediminis TaxID=2170577 RepID=UPI00248F62FC|nr:IclR family transcriptional regulator [Thalassorhabdomicrobium marinisediminis]